MASTVFVNGSTLSDDAWFNDVNTITYTGLTTQILVGGGTGSVGVWTAATGTGAPVRATSPTMTTPIINSAAHVGGTWVADATWTLPAFTLGGTVSGGGNQINNVIIGTSTPLAGSFTTLSVGTNPASAGVIRIPFNANIAGRNATNNGDVVIAYVDTDNVIALGGTAGVSIGGALGVTGTLTGAAGSFTTLTETTGAAWTTYTPTLTTDTGTFGALTVSNAAYRLLGKTLFIRLNCFATVATGSPTEFRLSLPTGTLKSDTFMAAILWNNGALEAAYQQAGAGVAYLALTRFAGAVMTGQIICRNIFVVELA